MGTGSSWPQSARWIAPLSLQAATSLPLSIQFRWGCSVGEASFASPAKAILANPVIAGIADVCAGGDDQRLAE
jgi:hypothetical protein